MDIETELDQIREALSGIETKVNDGVSVEGITAWIEAADIDLEDLKWAYRDAVRYGVKGILNRGNYVDLANILAKCEVDLEAVVKSIVGLSVFPDTFSPLALVNRENILDYLAGLGAAEVGLLLIDLYTSPQFSTDVDGAMRGSFP